VCRHQWERHRLMSISDQLERIADYKELASVRPDDPNNALPFIITRTSALPSKLVRSRYPNNLAMASHAAMALGLR